MAELPTGLDASMAEGLQKLLAELAAQEDPEVCVSLRPGERGGGWVGRMH